MKKTQLRFTNLPNSTFSQTKEEVDHLLGEKSIKKVVKAILIINVLIIGFLIVVWPKLPPEVPLFYSRPWGEPQLAKKTELWLLSASGWTLTLINLKISSKIFARHQTLTLALIWSNLVGVLLASIALIEIVLLAT
ncbi:hypothetical protein KKD62_03785 [Patescibacteria group bacterium]|nr:hypothetical protein [Patescibacteria group bacterium]MBU1931128.1 hypothetical protein [Patescibacteria group bacterium]